MSDLLEMTKTILNPGGHPKIIVLDGKSYVEVDWVLEQLDNLKEIKDDNKS